MSTAEWKSRRIVMLSMRAAIVAFIQTCNSSVITLPTQIGSREVIPMKLLLQRKSSGCLHAMIDVCNTMMSFYLFLQMGMSIESQRWLRYCLPTKSVPQNVLCHEQDDRVEVRDMWSYPYSLSPNC